MLLSLFCVCALIGCQRELSTTRLSGQIMGTVWRVSIVDLDETQAEVLHSLIQQELGAVDGAMSTYLPDSDISRFNRAPVAQCVKVSPHTWRVSEAALDVSRQTANAFNPGVSALVELWGFGAGPAIATVPEDHRVEAALQQSQLSQLLMEASQKALCKKGPIALDFSAIAKGYGVDHIAALLVERGHRNFLVEIGGEVKTAGLNARRKPWRIGIEKPHLLRGGVVAAINLSGLAVATSGDYRNYREIEGQRYSHTIDPRTGMPVTHQLASVTVVMSSAMLADAYATALNVMGPEGGMAFAQERALPVYMVVKDQEGFKSQYSSAFIPYLDSEE